MTDSVPIEYELSYGGRQPKKDVPPMEWDSWEMNPAGSGFSFDAFSKSDQPAAPQWETPGLLPGTASLKELTGLGPIARFWKTRRQYAGTYDDKWKSQIGVEKILDYPADFDLRFFHCAHPKLQSNKPLLGNESIGLIGMIKERREYEGYLPGFKLMANIGKLKVPLNLDTLHIDLQTRQIHLVWRIAIDQRKNIKSLYLYKLY